MVSSREMVNVAENCRSVWDRIADAASKCGRRADEVKLLAATKTQDIQAIEAAIDAGITVCGENYVQEAAVKIKQIARPISWHMIGHLQRNKAKAAAEIFAVIETLDNLALARELDKAGRKLGKVIESLVEVNLAGEESKTGIGATELIDLLREVGKLEHLTVRGLMTIPPFRQDPEEVRPYFRRLRQLKDEINGLELPGAKLIELSMGMTHDFAVAIEEGATIVRVGTAIFGPRRV